jgi:hypothetical protein
MYKIQVAVLNEYAGFTNDEVERVVKALQIQVSEHFAPAWGINADITYYPDKNPPPSSWQLVILDASDQAGALGYHDLTNHGLPLGKVFAGTDRVYGNCWSVTASHELLEMLADPGINIAVFHENDNKPGVLYAYENCDACESDDYAYMIEDIKVSDFVFPSWFEKFHPEGTQYDYCKLIMKPFEILHGGHIGIFDMLSGRGWYQKTYQDSHATIHIRGKVGSRRERRRTPRYQWLRSTAHHIAR